MPPDWAVLQLGAMQLHWEPDWISWCSDHLYRCNGSSIGAHAVGLRRETFRPLLEACARRELPFDPRGDLATSGATSASSTQS